MSKKEKRIANPAPLGLLGFGATTVLLNLTNAGLTELSAIVLVMGVFYGGIAQILAGIFEFRAEKGFGGTAFISYGLFWFTLVGLIVLPKVGFMPAPSIQSMAAYFIIWAIITFGFMIIAKDNKITFAVFITLFILFVLLTVTELTNNNVLKIITGYEGILCGAIAIFDALYQMIKTHLTEKKA